MPADPKLGRAAALRNAMLAYMNDKESLLNAYQAFWAQSCRRRRPRVAVDPIFATIEEYKRTDNDVCDLWRQPDDDYGYYNYEELISLDKARVSYHRQRSQAADRQRHHELLGSPVLRRGLYPAWGHGRSGGLRAPYGESTDCQPENPNVAGNERSKPTRSWPRTNGACRGKPEFVNVHDFMDRKLGRAVCLRHERQCWMGQRRLTLPPLRSMRSVDGGRPWRCQTHAPGQSKRLCVRHFARARPATHEVIADVRAYSGRFCAPITGQR